MQYVEEKIENIHRSMVFKDLEFVGKTVKSDADKKMEELLHVRKSIIQIEQRIKKKETLREQSL